MNRKLASIVTFIVTITCIGNCLAQRNKILRGAFLQEGSKARIDHVEVRNLRNNQVFYSNKFGLFEAICQLGDTLSVERSDYHSKKIFIKDFTDLVVILRPINQLKEVKITAQSASDYFKEVSAAYSKEKGIFYGGKPSIWLLLPFDGKPITFFYELLGKDGRRVRRLNKLASKAAEYEELDQYFNSSIIQQIIPIDTGNLEEFKLIYTPPLETLRKWSDYQRATYIKSKFKEFRTNLDY